MEPNERGQAAIEWVAPTARRLHAQAAMEYLVTYGWALLALFLVTALLIASGAFSAGSFSSQECVFQPDLPCSSFVLYKSGANTQLNFTLTNGLGFPINITNISFVATSLGAQGRKEYPGGITTPIPLLPGTSRSFNYSFTDQEIQPPPKDSRTIQVLLTYWNCAGNPCTGPYKTNGRISTTIEKGY